MWPGPPDFSTMAARHMGFSNIAEAKRADLGHFNRVEALVSTSCPAPPVTPLPAALFPVMDVYLTVHASSNQGDDLKVDPWGVDAERQSHFFECEQPSPCASFCHMRGSVIWLAGNCALCRP